MLATDRQTASTCIVGGGQGDDHQLEGKWSETSGSDFCWGWIWWHIVGQVLGQKWWRDYAQWIHEAGQRV